MPLDNARKTQHILDVTNRSFQGRTRTVVFVYQSGASYTYTAISVIFRPEAVIDPQIPATGGGAPSVPADMYLVAPITVSFVGVVFIADTATATAGACAAAKKYEVIEAVPVGLLPGGTHIKALLRRLR